MPLLQNPKTRFGTLSVHYVMNFSGQKRSETTFCFPKVSLPKGPPKSPETLENAAKKGPPKRWSSEEGDRRI